MSDNLLCLWRKFQKSSNKDELLLFNFINKLRGSTLWLEGERQEGEIKATLFSVPEEYGEPCLLAYVGEEGPPKILDKAIANGVVYQKIAGDAFFLNANSQSYDVILVENSDSLEIFPKKMVELICLLLLNLDDELSTSNTVSKSKKISLKKNHFMNAFFILFIAIMIYAPFSDFGRGILDVNKQASDEVSSRPRHLVQEEFLNGQFTIGIPYQYEVDNRKKELISELESGAVFRIYENKKSKSHIINIGILPSLSYTRGIPDRLMKMGREIALSTNAIGKIKNATVIDKEHVNINGADMVTVKTRGDVDGHEVVITTLLTEIETVINKKVVFVQVISIKDQINTHDIFAKKIFNSITVKESR